ncbi:MAG TPA: DUF6776 family protein [Burkholderiaceae bacterium]
MRFRLLRRRLTISAPRMAVRSALPWPLRWIMLALALGFCAAISLWAFEFGKHIAGLDRDHEKELTGLRDEVARLRAERAHGLASNNTASSLLVAEQVAQEKLVQQIKQLEAENRAMRDDLGFFEQLIPAEGGQSISVRSLQAEVLGGGAQLKWQVLVLQPARHAPAFDGRLEVMLSGTLAGKPWAMNLPDGPQALKFRQYRRVEGLVDLPAQAVVKNVSVKVIEGNATRASHSIKL